MTFKGIHLITPTRLYGRCYVSNNLVKMWKTTELVDCWHWRHLDAFSSSSYNYIHARYDKAG